MSHIYHVRQLLAAFEFLEGSLASGGKHYQRHFLAIYWGEKEDLL